MKSQVSAILHVLRGLLTDVQSAYPALRGVDRDLSRLSLLAQTRGLGSLSLDLPVLDDLLLAGLRDGRLPLDSQPFGWVSKKCRVPKLFSGLWLRVFDRDAMLKPDADINAVMFLRQLSCIAKKVTAPCSDERVSNALKGYIDVETSIRSPSLNWDGDQLDSEGRLKGLHLVEIGETDLPLLGVYDTERRRANSLLSKCQQVADTILSRLSWYDPRSWSDSMILEKGVSGFKHGTGAVSNKTKTGFKSDFASWPRKLGSTFPFEEFGKMPLDDRNVPEMEHPSQMHMVPKTLKGPRIIAAEPAEHLWCQQSILGYLNHEFNRLFGGDFIDLFDQGKSGKMVLQASLDGKHATVDLSDASDRLSCFVVERMFRRNPPLLTALHAARTRYVRFNRNGHREFLKFKKFVSQGTSTTFPVQSLVFLIIAITSCIGNDVSWRSIMRLRRSVRVYGDDIIVPTHGYEDLKFLMTRLGLKVNDKKSFATGSFRESCGTDGYLGYDVTPIRPKVFSPNGPGDIVALIDECNNLFKKGYWHASISLQSLIPNFALRRIRIVGPDASGISGGLFSFAGEYESHLVSRWNHNLQRREVRVFASYTNTRRSLRSAYSGLVDFSTMAHNPWNPRVVSEVPGKRYTKGGVRWEPSNAIT